MSVLQKANKQKRLVRGARVTLVGSHLFIRDDMDTIDDCIEELEYLNMINVGVKVYVTSVTVYSSFYEEPSVSS